MFALTVVSLLAVSVAPTEGETKAVEGWCAQAFGDNAANVPFSFGYGDGASRQVLPTWPSEREGEPSKTSTLKWRDAATGLEVRCEVTRFADFPAVEWVLYFKNTGSADTPVLDTIQALDCGVARTREKEVRLHYAKGSECRRDDFAPQVMPLSPGGDDPQGVWIQEGNRFAFGSHSGRSSCGALPFFNLELDNRGVIGAIGWTGDWNATFYCTKEEVRMRAGMQRTHLKLHPGEEIRSPRMMLLFWEGDRMRGHNLLRQFILAHHRPTVNGQPATAPIAHATWGGNFADKHIAHGRWWKDNKLPMEYLWVDAGWFGEDEAKEGANVFNSRWGSFVGDWKPNPGYFPQGLAQVSDALQQMGMSFLLWLEPERVFKDTPWTKEHPEWLYGPVGDNYLFNLGNPEARKGLADFLSKLIEDGKIGCYRQDFNMDPQPFWHAADEKEGPDREGISEIKHITGLYALWDDLRTLHPGLLIDNCSSGGRRIDLETISRSIPLWRSDFQCFPSFSPTGMQGQTQGLNLWVPLSSGCCDREDTYAFRSALGPGMVIGMGDFEKDSSKHFSIDWLRDRLNELNATRNYFLGDFYPLLSFSLEDDTWAAWQFDRPDLGEGAIVAFSRPESPITTVVAKLQNLDPKAKYRVRDLDTGRSRKLTGAELAKKGITVRIKKAPGSKIFVYKKAEK